ncbi:hypothetical protein AQJ58_29105 [Streptomyces sp. DSM 15324]|nr:hypothetical protein AQJ58_29105 [Streptomyces sp. DSM 15324]
MSRFPSTSRRSHFQPVSEVGRVDVPWLGLRGDRALADVRIRIAVLFRFYATAMHRSQQRSNEQIERALEG